MEDLFVNLAELIVWVFEEELLDPVCADQKGITLAILLVLVTCSLCQAAKDWTSGQ